MRALARALRAGPRPGGGEPVRGRGGSGRGANAPEVSIATEPAEIDAELLDDVLCSIAREHLHRHWSERRAELTDSLRRSLADVEEQDEAAQREATGFAAVLELSERDREALVEGHTQQRRARVGEALAALRAEPSDYDALYRAGRGLFADEDALVERIAGSRALPRLRASQLERRTAILALLATYADIPWDRAIEH